MVTLDVGDSGQIFEKSQVTDYRCRGVNLEHHNVLTLFVDTYEEHIPKVFRNRSDHIQHSGRGRQPHSRFPYLHTHPKAQDRRRVARSTNHRNLPDFVGSWPARSDDIENDEFYCASMLVLLKPWRQIGRDLKSPSESWRQAFNSYLGSKTDEERIHTDRILSGIQYHHECDSAARADRAKQHAEDHGEHRVQCNHAAAAEVDEGSDLENEDLGRSLQSEAHLLHLQSVPLNEKEHLHAVAAVSIAKHHGIFGRGLNTWEVGPATVSNAMGDDVAKLLRWQKQLNADKARINGETVIVNTSIGSAESDAMVVCTTTSEASSSAGQVCVVAPSSQPTIEVNSAILKADQYRAYDLITWHLEQTLAGAEPPPLRMILYGEGGTGKSKVIQTVTDAFDARGVGHLLVKAAYTGVAASLINGKTTHNIAAMPTTKKLDTKLSDSAKSRLQVFWAQVTYLIIDEYSMLSKTFLAILSRNITIAKSGSATFRAGHSFGGINVILCGDLHQFPPVVCAREEYLFYENSLRRDVNPSCATRPTGRLIYEEFNTVVVLKEQMRVTDPIWRDVLVHLRQGEMQTRHIKVLRSLILGQAQESIGPSDFSTLPWSQACLVTPRHAVRRMWNSEASRKACKLANRHLFHCIAEDTVAGRSLTLAEKYELVDRGKTDNLQQKNDLPRRIELAIGMQVLVTDNIETDLDLTNGARGEIIDIILHPDEPLPGDDAITELQYLPLYLLVKMTRTRASRLEGLEEGVIPVEPKQTSMRITFKTGPMKGKSSTIRRRPFTVTPA